MKKRYALVYMGKNKKWVEFHRCFESVEKAQCLLDEFIQSEQALKGFTNICS